MSRGGSQVSGCKITSLILRLISLARLCSKISKQICPILNDELMFFEIDPEHCSIYFGPTCASLGNKTLATKFDIPWNVALYWLGGLYRKFVKLFLIEIVTNKITIIPIINFFSLAYLLQVVRLEWMFIIAVISRADSITGTVVGMVMWMNAQVAAWIILDGCIVSGARLRGVCFGILWHTSD